MAIWLQTGHSKILAEFSLAAGPPNLQTSPGVKYWLKLIWWFQPQQPNLIHHQYYHLYGISRTRKRKVRRASNCVQYCTVSRVESNNSMPHSGVCFVESKFIFQSKFIFLMHKVRVLDECCYVHGRETHSHAFSLHGFEGLLGLGIRVWS